MSDFLQPNGSILLHSQTGDPESATPTTPFGVRRTDASTSPLAEISMFAAGTGNLQGVIALSTMNSGTSSGALVERMRIHTNGSFGIGTQAPTYTLDVAGTLGVSAAVTLATASGNVGIGTNLPTTKLDVLGTARVNGGLTVTGATSLATTSGNVGIGNTNPSSKLHVTGSARINGSLDLPDAGTSITFGSTTRQMINLWSTSYAIGVQSGTAYFRTAGSFAFFKGGVHDNTALTPGTGGSTLMVIKDNGRVGIGTTTPISTLHVAGTVTWGLGGEKFGFTNLGQIFVMAPDAGSGADPEKGLTFSGGGVSVGTVFSEGYKFLVDGNAYVNGTFHYNALHQESSRTLKHNFDDLSADEALAVLRGLSAVKFNYKRDPTDQLHVGFIAEDVPPLVGSKDRKSVVTTNVLGVVARVVQSQQETIERLERRIEALQGRDVS